MSALAGDSLLGRPSDIAVGIKTETKPSAIRAATEACAGDEKFGARSVVMAVLLFHLP